MSKTRMNEATAITIPPSSQVPISVRGRRVTVNCPPSARIEVSVRIVGEEDELINVQLSRDQDPYKVCIVHDDPPPIPSIQINDATPCERVHPDDVVATLVEPAPLIEVQPGAVHVEGIDLMSESLSHDEQQTIVQEDAMSGITLDWELVHSRDENDVEEEEEEESPPPQEQLEGPLVSIPEDEPQHQPPPPQEQPLVEMPFLAREGNWVRTLRLQNLKFQWVRVDDNGDLVDANSVRFDVDQSAYACQLLFQPGEDPRLRTGLLTLPSASNVMASTKIMSADNRELISYHDIAEIQGRTFEEKVDWFQRACGHICVDWNEGHMCMNIRRQFLLQDSVDAVMSLSRKDLRKFWRFYFIGEEGIDAGGVAREWFQLVTKECFDPDIGLWQSNSVGRMRMEINPASEHCCEDHLVYFRFLGRVLGKALFDRHLVAGNMVPHIYKHLLSWPITFSDLEQVDEGYYRNLKQLADLAKSGIDLSLLCLDFVTTEEIMGQKQGIELVQGGRDIEVDNDNYPEYLEACLKYRVMERVKPQLTELLLGFFDVIPAPLLTIFDPRELELLMCGKKEIDIDDWMQHTLYSGEFDGTNGEHEVCRWFWEVVRELDDEDITARLLQFVTGASTVPAGGFGALPGNDGTVRLFTIHGIQRNISFYPRAHTCFNRIDLPLYDTKEELKERLMLALTMVATGFDME